MNLSLSKNDKTRRVLWVEDAARVEYQDLITPIYAAGYDLTLAPDATQGVSAISRDEFACVIFDIRLPPGSDYRWREVFRECGNDPAAARLGMEIIRAYFQASSSPGVGRRFQLSAGAWFRPDICGVFSVDVDENIRREVFSYGFRECHPKKGNGSRRRVLDIINAITGNTDSLT